MTTELRRIKDEEYFAIRDRFHASDAGKLLTSPAYFKYCQDNPSGPTASMIPGKICHAAIGDPAELVLYVTEVPGLAGLCNDKGKPYADPAKSDAGKAIIAAWKEDNPNACIVTQETLNTGLAMAERLKTREGSKGWGEALHREVAVLWDDQDGVPCILKVDALFDCGTHLVLLDYKKHGKILSNHSLRTSIGDFGYHRAAAHYLDGIGAAQDAGLLPQVPVEYWLGWVSEVLPHETHFQIVGKDLIDIGAKELQDAKVRWMEGRASGVWPEATDMGLLEVQASLPYYKRSSTAAAANAEYTAALAELEGL